MGNPRREYIVFTNKAEDFWELWRCRGNKASFVGDANKHTENDRYHKTVYSKDAMCELRVRMGFTKFYGNKQDVEDYLFLLAI